MTIIFITLGLIVTYFVIAAIKEGEARDTIDRERKLNNKKLADIYFQTMVNQELSKQNIINDARKLFVKQLEDQEGILKATINENVLNIYTENYINIIEATEFANVWINSLLPSTGIDFVNVYNSDGIICGSAERL
ncbi:hypothetical protein [Flavobacterium chungnamense]|uniref:Uncharacterized protein n=1 Tax=Flavobacterium chungnamense TaxID=706182 RepID=A0ABP7V2B0_9FLAO